MKNRKLYPLADRYPDSEVPGVGHVGRHQTDLRAYATGEKRPPMAGEWYLSGNPVEAWRAPNDFQTPYHIARIVRVKKVTFETVVERL